MQLKRFPIQNDLSLTFKNVIHLIGFEMIMILRIVDFCNMKI